MKLNEMIESLERLYLTEDRNHENDEVNDVIRRNRKTPINKISDADKQILRDNGITVQGQKNGRPVFRGNNRAFKLGRDYSEFNFGNSSSNDLNPAPFGKGGASYPDFDNPNYDIKGWLDTKRSREIENPNSPRFRVATGLKPKVDTYRKSSQYADEAEQAGRKYRKHAEADIENELLDSPDSTLLSGSRAGIRANYRADSEYDTARRLRDYSKRVAQRVKQERGVYESLTEDYEDNVAELQQFILEVIGDALDNIAMVAASKFSWYNPDWCSDDATDFVNCLVKASKDFTKSLLINKGK